MRDKLLLLLSIPLLSGTRGNINNPILKDNYYVGVHPNSFYKYQLNDNMYTQDLYIHFESFGGDQFKTYNIEFEMLPKSFYRFLTPSGTEGLPFLLQYPYKIKEDNNFISTISLQGENRPITSYDIDLTTFNLTGFLSPINYGFLNDYANNHLIGSESYITFTYRILTSHETQDNEMVQKIGNSFFTNSIELYYLEEQYQAYQNGHSAGFNRGYDVGFNEGASANYQIGYTTGQASGYIQGYADGINNLPQSLQEAYDRGFNDGSKDSFLANIKVWIVPAIIAVLFIGGGLTILQARRKGND